MAKIKNLFSILFLAAMTEILVHFFDVDFKEADDKASVCKHDSSAALWKTLDLNDKDLNNLICLKWPKLV